MARTMTTDKKSTSTADGRGKLVTMSKRAEAFYKEHYINLLAMSQNRLRIAEDTIKKLEERLSERGIPFEAAEKHTSKVISDDKYSVAYRRAVWNDCRIRANNAEKRIKQLRDTLIR